jgi:hypothetical protein
MSPVIFTLLLFAIAAGSLGLAAYFYQRREKEWLRREREWREREMGLVDRLLKQGQVATLTVDREKVVKLSDPEIQPASWIDDAFMIDSIKEELEQIYPEAARMSHAEAQARYAKEWQGIARKLKEEATPLRA